MPQLSSTWRAWRPTWTGSGYGGHALDAGSTDSPGAAGWRQYACLRRGSVAGRDNGAGGLPENVTASLSAPGCACFTQCGGAEHAMTIAVWLDADDAIH